MKELLQQTCDLLRRTVFNYSDDEALAKNLADKLEAVINAQDDVIKMRKMLDQYRQVFMPGPPILAPVGWVKGNLLTINQDGYPGLGRWHQQIWNGDDVVARFYGNSHEELSERISVIFPTNGI